jgi:hypothetical protein
MFEVGIHPFEVGARDPLAFAEVGVCNNVRVLGRQNVMYGSAEHHVADVSGESASGDVINRSGCA